MVGADLSSLNGSSASGSIDLGDGRTLTSLPVPAPRAVLAEGERALYHALYPSRHALHSSDDFARACGLALLAQARAAAGSLDRIARVVKLTGFVASTPEFTDQPEVINGCSDLMVEVFGDAGRHARSAVGVYKLPLGFAVEVDAIVEIR